MSHNFQTPAGQERGYSTIIDSIAPQDLADAPPDACQVTPEVLAKAAQLHELFRQMKSVVVAFSGGVDSAYVAHVATAELSARALCVTGDSPSLSRSERDGVKELAAKFNFTHEIINTEETADPRYQANPTNRCYFCKTELYTKLSALARARQIDFVVDGSNTDDTGDHRPGRTAAQERGVRSPLIEVGLSKAEIRQLSRLAGLPTWDKPSSPCLSSRIAYGTPVTIERLQTVETGEAAMRRLGFREFRVRHHDELVRLEIAPSELNLALDRKVVDELAATFRRLGFRYVTLDLHGYRTGAMNEVLKHSE